MMILIQQKVIYIESGDFDISADGDAISAETDVLVTDSDFNIISGGGSSHNVSSSVSAKGIKGIVNVIINGENFVINSADDAIHSNGNIAVNGGQFSISSDDDGIHAGQALTINDGENDIQNLMTE